MADTVVNTFCKNSIAGNLPNRVQLDHLAFDFGKYSAANVTVGAGDTLQFKLLSLPAKSVLKSVVVHVKVANGAALTATVTDGSSALHASTFDLNSATVQYKAASTTNITAATNVYLVFPNSAAIKTVLEIDVCIEFFPAETRSWGA